MHKFSSLYAQLCYKLRTSNQQDQLGGSTGDHRLIKIGAPVLMVALVAGSLFLFSDYKNNASAAPLSLCGNTAPATQTQIQHVVVVMMENHSYKQVVGGGNTPYQTSLAQTCGSATAMFGATHTSAANYLALSAGEFPAASPPGCGSVAVCADTSDNLYNQLDTAGKTWRAYEESMGTVCNPKTADPYKIGHNPPIFYKNIPASECQANDLPIADLTAQSGALWNDLQNQTLPNFSWVTPNENNDGEGPGTAAQSMKAADTWLQNFLATVQQSNSYQSGNTVVLVTYDEGTGSDSKTGEDCTNQSLDMPVTNGTSAHQDSCHVPFFVVYPYTTAGTQDGTFFDHYSVTKTVEDFFGLPYIAHAADAQTNSLIGHFGLSLNTGSIPNPPDDTPSISVTGPTDGTSVTGTVTATASASSPASDVTNVEFYVDNTLVTSTSQSPYTASIDTTTLTNGTHALTAKAYTASNATQTSSPISLIVNNNIVTATACAAPPAGITELSSNVSLETNQNGWTGVYNSNSNPTRLQVSGGSYDGQWALSVAPKAGATGAAGVNNASPIWIPGSPGAAIVAGKSYTGSVMVKASVAGESVNLMLRETTTSGTGVAFHTTTVTLPDTDWHSLQSLYIGANSGDVLRYSLFATNFTSSSQFFLADCLSLQSN